MNITEAKENISSLYEKALNKCPDSSRTHPIRIIQAVKSIIGINKDNPIEELLIFCEKYVNTFESKNVDFNIDESSISEMISYKKLEEALVNLNGPLAQQRAYELSRVSEGMQIIEFLLEFSFKFSKKSAFLIWSIYRMILFLDKQFILQSILVCVESILSSKEISKNDFVFKGGINSFDSLNIKEYDQCSVLSAIYFSDLVRKEKIINAMSKIAIFDEDCKEKYTGIYKSRMKIWLYVSQKKNNELDCNMILDLDAIRSLMKVAEDNNLIPHGIYKYVQKYIE